MVPHEFCILTFFFFQSKNAIRILRDVLDNNRHGDVYFNKTKLRSCAVIIINLYYYTCVPGRAFSIQVCIYDAFIHFYM